MNDTNMTDSQDLKERLAEAARYALLRRLAPALRHNMAGALQPISMMAAMLEKRLQKPEPDIPSLGKNSAALNTLAREASLTCMDLMSWLAPRDKELVPLGKGLEEVVGLLATELSFRGFTVLNEAGDIQGQLPRSVLRNVFMAMLVTLTDLGKTPANVVLKAAEVNGALLISLTLHAVEGEPLSPGHAAYRKLGWDDAKALAEAESAEISHTDNSAELRYGAH